MKFTYGFLIGVTVGWLGFWYVNGQKDIVIIRGGEAALEQEVIVKPKRYKCVFPDGRELITENREDCR